VLVDVRSRTEWDGGHLGGALHVPLAFLPDRLDELPRDRPIVVYCRSGARSAIAASLLRASGFADVANLRGGIEAWLASALPTDEAPAAWPPAAA
jgi:hydroxyacylglutathione hydrolase